MSSEVVIRSKQKRKKMNLRLLRVLTQSILEDLSLDAVEVGILIVADPEMSLLNEQFLHHSGSTDVITFSYVEPPRKGRYLDKIQGEIVVCVDEAIRMAARFRTSWQSEMVRYVIHGILHLQGHDDQEASSRREMKKVENRLLKTLSRNYELEQLAK